MTNSTPYRGFEIQNKSGLFVITMNGKQVFTAHWQVCFSLEEAMKLIDISLKAKAEFENKPVIKKPRFFGSCELEHGATAAQEFERWMNNEAEKQLNENYL